MHAVAPSGAAQGSRRKPARIGDLVAATKVPKEGADFGEHGEVVGSRITMTLVRKDGTGARYGNANGTPDPHDRHGQTIRRFLDALTF